VQTVPVFKVKSSLKCDVSNYAAVTWSWWSTKVLLLVSARADPGFAKRGRTMAGVSAGSRGRSPWSWKHFVHFHTKEGVCPCPEPPLLLLLTHTTFAFWLNWLTSPGLLQVRSAGFPREKLEIAAAGFHFTDRMHFLIRQATASEQQRPAQY